MAALTPRFWASVALTGVAAGLFGVAMMALLTTVEHIGFGYDSGSFQSGVEQASGLRRAVALLVAGVIGGVGWFLLCRYTRGQRAEADEAAWFGSALSWPRSLGTSVLSEIAIGVVTLHVAPPALVWAVLAGPLIGLVAVGFIRLIAGVSHRALIPVQRPTALTPVLAPST